MEKPTDFQDVPMEECSTIFPSSQLLSRPPVIPGLQMPPGLLMPYCLQSLSLSAGLQLPLRPTVNPEFQVYPHPSDPPCFPVLTAQVFPEPEAHFKAPSKEQCECIWHTKKQKQELEAYFRFCKFPTHKQRVELGQRIDLKEYQIQVWFRNWRARYSQEHIQEYQ